MPPPAGVPEWPEAYCPRPPIPGVPRGAEPPLPQGSAAAAAVGRTSSRGVWWRAQRGVWGARPPGRFRGARCPPKRPETKKTDGGNVGETASPLPIMAAAPPPALLAGGGTPGPNQGMNTVKAPQGLPEGRARADRGPRPGESQPLEERLLERLDRDVVSADMGGWIRAGVGPWRGCCQGPWGTTCRGSPSASRCRGHWC